MAGVFGDYSQLFRLAKRRSLPFIADIGILLFYAWRFHMELTKNNSSHSQLSCKLKGNIKK